VRPIVVFNSHTWSTHVNLEMESNPWNPGSILLDDSDLIISHQEVQSTTATGRTRLTFTAHLPALGYRTYRLVPNPPTSEILNQPILSEDGSRHTFITTGEKGESNKQTVRASDSILESSRFRLEFDPRTGCIASLRDKLADLEVFSGLAAKAVVIDDPNDTWAHNFFKWDKVIGEFAVTDLRLVEHGPVKSVIRVASQYGASSLVQEFSMYPDMDQIDVRLVVDWREQLKMLKLRFPINVKCMKVTHGIPYGYIERPANGEEEPFQSWVDVSGTSCDKEIPYGFSLLNDGKYSLDVSVGDIGLTVLRSPAYANHIPSVLKPGGMYSYIDQGIQRFNYILMPHAGSWETAGTVRRAAELNLPPIALYATFHPEGTLPQSDSFIVVDPENLMVSVLKQAEDGDDLVLRAYEASGAATHAAIYLPKWGRGIEVGFGPCEIKTFRIPRDSSKPIKETNLLEWEV
jgi:alpha-mannosidase